nr:hypothetical protein [Candidatus Brocadiales bacterium]
MKKEIKWLIKKTLKKLGLYSEEASQLIFRTGMAESKYKHLRQINGPALGFFQIEPDTARDIWENYVAYRPLIKTHLWSLGFEESNLEYCMMSNIGLQIAFCRLHYRRIPTKLP